jgi:hypothetical protein
MTSKVAYRNDLLRGAVAVMLMVHLVACSSSGPDAAARTDAGGAHESAVSDPAEGSKTTAAAERAESIREKNPATRSSEGKQSVHNAEKKPAYTERSERVMGFRLQLHSTTDPAEARRAMSTMREKLDSLGMEQGRMDLVFDAPFYKLRYGDYIMKADADRERGVFHELGFPAAFVVRDHIVRIIRERAK